METTYTKSGATKHREDCGRVFKNYDMACPRCQELSNGSSPRDGWQKSYYEAKARDARIWEAHLKSQHCDHNNTNPGGYCNTCGKGVDFS